MSGFPVNTKARHRWGPSGVTKEWPRDASASLRGRDPLRAPSPLGVGTRAAQDPPARPAPRGDQPTTPLRPEPPTRRPQSPRTRPRIPPGPRRAVPAPPRPGAWNPALPRVSEPGGRRAGRGAREAEPSRGILLRASAGPRRAAEPSEGPRAGGGGEPQTQPVREGSPRHAIHRHRLRAAPAGWQVPGRALPPPGRQTRGPAVSSPARLPRAMQPPPAPRA